MTHWESYGRPSNERWEPRILLSERQIERGLFAVGLVGPQMELRAESRGSLEKS